MTNKTANGLFCPPETRQLTEALLQSYLFALVESNRLSGANRSLITRACQFLTATEVPMVAEVCHLMRLVVDHSKTLPQHVQTAIWEIDGLCVHLDMQIREEREAAAEAEAAAEEEEDEEAEEGAVIECNEQEEPPPPETEGE